MEQFKLYSYKNNVFNQQKLNTISSAKKYERLKTEPNKDIS